MAEAEASNTNTGSQDGQEPMEIEKSEPKKEEENSFFEDLFNRPKIEFMNKVGEEITFNPKRQDFIYISNCKNFTLTMKDNASKIVIDSCTGVRVELEEDLTTGTTEIINSENITLVMRPEDSMPTLCAENCKDLHFYFYDPDGIGSIYTIKCSKVFVYLQPPRTEKNELELPEDDNQYVTKFRDEKFVTKLVVREAGGYATTQEELLLSRAKELQMRSLFEAFLRNLLSKSGASDEASGGDGDEGPVSSNIKDEEEKKEYFDTEEELTKKLDTVAEWVKESKHIIVFTGAGISTSSGIPDYRSGMNTVLKTGPGVWELVAHEAERPEGASVTPIINALPSPTHMAIVQLHKQNIVKYTVSQNIDGLHRRSGLPPSQLAELHGNTNLETCQKCKRQYLRDFETRESKYVFDHATSRKCADPECGGVLQDSIINFGEALPEQELENAFKEGDTADLCIVLGSSLRVGPANHVPRKVHKSGGKVVICNLQKIASYTPDEKTMQVFAKCDEFMEGLCKRLDVPIPPFVLHRRACISTKQGEDRAFVVTVTGLDIDEDLPYSFIKTAATKYGGEPLEVSNEPLTLTLPSGVEGPLPSITIQCQGHYGEPTFQLETPPVGEEHVYNMAYEVLADKSWVITKQQT